MRFSRFIMDWIGANPRLAVMLAAFGVILLLAISPLIIAVLPIRKVPTRYNLRNLQIRWKTTLVTALAFTLVTALLTVMLAFVNGMNRLSESSGHPGNVMVLSDGATDEAFSNLPPFTVEALPSELQGMIEKDGKDFLVAQEVYVIVTYNIPNVPEGGRKRRFVQMRGFDNPELAGKVHEVTLTPGSRWPSKAGVQAVTVTRDGKEVEETAIEIVLGDGVSRAFGADHGKEGMALGDKVEIGSGRYWIIVGIMNAANNTFGSEIWARDRPVQDTFGRNNPYNYSSYVVRAHDAKMAALAAEAFKRFRSERNLQATPERVYYSKLTDTNKQFSIAIYFVAIIMAIGGMLGIMNTMFAAISQRTKDVGVLRLMGYRRWQVFMSFQVESVLMAILGGALGILVAYVLTDGWTVTSIMSGGAGGGGKTVVLQLVVDGSVVLTGMLFSLLMGAFGGVLPSFRAMRLRPLDSLK